MAWPIVVRAPTMASNSVRRVRHVCAYVSSSVRRAAMSSLSLLIVLGRQGSVTVSRWCERSVARPSPPGHRPEGSLLTPAPSPSLVAC